MPRTRLNRAIGKGVGVGSIPTSQIKYFGAFGIGAMLLFMLGADIMLIAALFSATTVSWWGATNDDPGALWDDLKKPRNWIQGRYAQQFRSEGFPQGFPFKQKEIRYKEGDRTIVATPAESAHKLSTYLEYHKNNEEIGAYLLQERSKVKIIFCFKAKGFSPSVSESTAQNIIESVSEGLRQLPGMSLRFYLSKTSDAEDLIHAIKHKSGETDLEFVIKESQKQRYQELAAQGDLQSTTLHIYAIAHTTYGISGRAKGALEKLLSFSWGMMQGWTPTQDVLLRTLNNAYDNGFLPIRSCLSDASQFGLEVEPLTAKQMHGLDWKRFHHCPAPPVAQCPIVTDEGIDCSIINSELHPLSELWEPENGLPSEPKAFPGFVYIPSKDEYLGLVRIGRLESYPVKDGKYRSILNYLHNIITSVSECEVIIEVEPQDTQLVDKFQMERTFNYSVGRVAKVQAKGSIDKYSETMATEAAKAITEIEDGAKSTYVCGGIWVRRKDPEQIKTVLDRILPQLPLKSERVTRCAEYWFHQSLPFSWEQIGKKPTDRREKLFSSQMVGLLPLSRTPVIDPEGFPLISVDGSPIKINITRGKNNLLLVATSRAGKSIQLEEIIFEFYTQGYPVAVFDFPRPDGTSTYTPIVDFLNSMGGSAAYFDVGSETINCIEWVDEDAIWAIAEHEAREGKVLKAFNRRMGEIYNSHIELLKLVVVGDMPASQEKMQLESLLQNAYQAFCDDPNVQGLRQQSAKAEFGTPNRLKMPTLRDFREFADGYLELYIENQKRQSDITAQAADFLLARLDAVLSTSMGDAIGGQSSIDTSARLLVVALANVSDDLDTEIYSLAADTLLTRKAIQSQYSAFIVDEGTIMFKRNRFSLRAEQKAANGHKWGMHLIIAAQTIDTILKSDGADGIFKNMNNRLVGFIEEDAIEGLVEIGFHRHIVEKYIQTSYRPDGAKIRSRWYFKRGGEHIECFHYPGKMSLAIGANDPDEEAARQLYLQCYPDKIEGLIEYAKAHEAAKKNNLPIEPPAAALPVAI